MKKVVVILFLTMIAVLGLKAQQDPMNTQYMNQLLSINPAYAGAKGVTSATMIVREQWVGWEGHPQTQTLFVHSPLSDQVGIGGSIVNDKIGPVSNTILFGDYSYSILLPGERYVSFGLKAGFSLYRVAMSEIIEYYSNSGYAGHSVDDPVFQEDLSRFMPNAGVGIYYSSPKYYTGFSVPKLISNRITDESVETGAVSREKIHAFFMGGYVFDMTRILKFKPYFMARVTPNAPISLDLSGQFVFIEKLWLGATYRFGDSFGFMLQVQANTQLKIGYAYDLTTTELASYNSGTHEIMLSFDFSFGRGAVRSPRYF